MPNDLRVLLALRLRGSADDTELAEAAGVEVGDLDELGARGLLVRRAGPSGRWVLTGTGREALGAGLAAELDEHHAAAEVAAAYHDFVAVNGPFLELCTRWQLRPTAAGRAPNDHTDPAYDADVIVELDRTHEAVLAIVDRLTRVLDRFSGYRPRFEHALGEVHAGRREWFDSARVDSYHSVWFELHENLLATLGRERSTEGR